MVERVNVLLDLEIDMLYTFGDSITYGSDLIDSGVSNEEKINLTWPGVLAKLTKSELTDLSFPASSSWRISRQIQNLNLTKDDIVIIQWTSPIRFEFGVNDEHDCESKSDKEIYRMVDSIQDENGLRTKAMCYSVMFKTTDKNCKDMMKLAYGKFYNHLWYEEMFRIMVKSSLYELDKSNCRYIMFDGWMKNCHEKFFKDVPNYVFRGTTIANRCRNVPGTERDNHNYATEKEHEIMAQLIHKELIKIYGE